MRKALYFLLVAMVAVLSASSIRSARADDAPPNMRVIVAVDSFVVRASERDALVADSVTRLSAGAENGSSIAFMSYGRTPGEVNEYEYGTGALIADLDEFQGLVMAGVGTGTSDQFKAIAAAFDYLSDTDAPAGSRLLLVTSDGMENETEAGRARLISLVELYQVEGWAIDVAMLPSASPISREFLARIAATSGGMAYDTGAIDGLSNLTADMYHVVPQPVIQTVLERGATALSPINVAPRTDRMTVSATRRSSHTSVELFDPRGAPVTGARPNVIVTETESAILIQIDQPEAGQWTARALGDETELLIGAEIVNTLSIDLVDALPLPVGESVLLAASAYDDAELVVLEGAHLDATVTSPSGSVVYRLNDAGNAGDAVAGDGIFSVLVPPFGDQVFSNVDLVLSWDNFGATVKDSATLQAEHFPKVVVTDLVPGPIDQGQLSPVAEIEITKAEFPFPIETAELDVRVISPNRVDIESAVTPIDMIDGKAWRFEVAAAPEFTGGYVVEAMLDTVYLERQFTAVDRVVDLQIGVIPRPVILPEPEPTLLDQVPVWAWAIIAILALAGIVAAIQRLIVRAQPIPYGYLYDDDGRMLVSFRRVRQGLVQRLFARNRVPASVVPDLQIGSGEFVFDSNGVRLQTKAATPNLRVNGRPAGSVTTLADQVRLGVGGRLFTFMMRRPTASYFGNPGGD